MDVSGVTGTNDYATSRFRRRFGDTAAGVHKLALNAIVASPPQESHGRILTGFSRIRSQSGFVAQLIACVNDFPQMRERRRASLAETLAAYSPPQALDADSSIISRYA